jgi:hypothetical protein
MPFDRNVERMAMHEKEDQTINILDAFRLALKFYSFKEKSSSDDY